MIIAIDFDGTCVTHEYPKIGKDIGAIPVLKELIDNGHQLILYTMRSNNYLQDAILWFSKNKIALYGVNENPTQKEWTNSPKCYANLYIDDAALGSPLIKPNNKKPFIDWNVVRSILINKNIIRFVKE